MYTGPLKFAEKYLINIIPKGHLVFEKHSISTKSMLCNFNATQKHWVSWKMTKIQNRTCFRDGILSINFFLFLLLRNINIFLGAGSFKWRNVWWTFPRNIQQALRAGICYINIKNKLPFLCGIKSCDCNIWEIDFFFFFILSRLGTCQNSSGQLSYRSAWRRSWCNQWQL